MRTTQILLPIMLVAIARSGDAAPTDLAARGLDLFVHAPTQAATGGRVPVQLRVFGFPTVSTLAPLPGAQVEATWDPETLGPDASSVPAAVSGTCDESGRAHLEVGVPPGKDKLSLLLSARWRGHERTRMVEITRLRRYAIELRVSDTKVVPGGTVSTWVLVSDQVTGQPVAGRPVDVALQEGSAARVSLRLTTDRAGMATTEVTAALESLQPEHLNGARAMADALEVFGRVRAWAIVRGGDTHPLAIRARELARQVVARRDLLRKKRSETDVERPLYQRGQRW